MTINKIKNINPSIDIKLLENRKKIADKIHEEILNQKLAIEEIERQSISKRIIYNIIQAKNYNINSLLQVIEVLKKKNKKFKINV